MNQSVDVSSSVDQGVPLATNVTSSSESLGWIGDISQHLPPLETVQNVLPSFVGTLQAIGAVLIAFWGLGVQRQQNHTQKQQFALATQNHAATLGLWTADDLDAMINHYRDQPPPIELSKYIQDEKKNTLRFPLNPVLGDLLEHNDVLLIEGGPGEGKTTQVLRTLFDKCSQTSTGQRPLILTAGFRDADPETKFLSLFFGNYQFPFEVTDYKILLRDVVKRAVDKNIPVYIVTDDVQQVVDMYPHGEVVTAAQSFFGTLMKLSLNYPDHVKIVHIASRMFSQDLLKFSGHRTRFRAYQWSYDPTLLCSTLEQSNNPMIVRHLDELLDMFGSRIQEYIELMKRMNEIGNGDVDNEKVYQAAVNKMKDECRDEIESALSAVKKVHRVAGAAQGHKLLTKLLEEQGKAVSFVNIADPNIVDILVRSNIIHANPRVTWASRFTSFVFEERYDEFAGFSGKQTSQKD